jgi:hypothetical protein
LTTFLLKIDIYANNPTRPVANFWGPITLLCQWRSYPNWQYLSSTPFLAKN